MENKKKSMEEEIFLTPEETTVSENNYDTATSDIMLSNKKVFEGNKIIFYTTSKKLWNSIAQVVIQAENVVIKQLELFALYIP